MRSLVGDPRAASAWRCACTFGLVFLLRTTPVLAVFDPMFLRGTRAGWVGRLGCTSAMGVAFLRLVYAVRGPSNACCELPDARCLHPNAGLVAGIAGYFLLAQDAFGYFHHLHLLYLGAILFALVDADSAFALRVSHRRVARSSLLLMRAFTASIYLWAAIGKLASEWGTGRALATFRAERCAPHPGSRREPLSSRSPSSRPS